MFSHISNKVP